MRQELYVDSDSIWLTREELAERTKVPKSTLAQWASRGTGPAYARFGRHCRYRLSDVVAWEQSQMRSAV